MDVKKKRIQKEFLNSQRVNYNLQWQARGQLIGKIIAYDDRFKLIHESGNTQLYTILKHPGKGHHTCIYRPHPLGEIPAQKLKYLLWTKDQILRSKSYPLIFLSNRNITLGHRPT